MKRLLSSCAVVLVLTSLPGAALSEPARFEGAEAAFETLVTALRSGDRDALIAIFGAENEDLIITGDPERDSTDREDFIAAFDEMHRVVEQDGVATLYIGSDQWPFPIHVSMSEDTWAFDVEAGRDELLERRIGRNELDVIDVLKAYVRIQSEYRRTDYDADGVMEFAAHVLSTPGTRDGLYWPQEDGAPESPVGDFVARAAAEGYSVGGQDVEPEPYLGYYFHVLAKQGENAPGGAIDYMVNGNMVAGHAMVAFPSAYGETGIMSFMVAENGEILEADLGENTLETAQQIESFNPTEEWSAAE